MMTLSSWLPGWQMSCRLGPERRDVAPCFGGHQNGDKEWPQGTEKITPMEVENRALVVPKL